jgi:hypothetical protein
MRSDFFADINLRTILDPDVIGAKFHWALLYGISAALQQAGIKGLNGFSYHTEIAGNTPYDFRNLRGEQIIFFYHEGHEGLEVIIRPFF